MKILIKFFLSSLVLSYPIFAENQAETPAPSTTAEEENTEIRIVIENSKETDNEEDSIVNSFLRKFREILLEIEKTTPKHIERQEEFYSRGIKGFLECINPELEYIPDNIEYKAEKIKDAPYFKPVIIASQKILYIRLDGFTEENFKHLKEDLIEISGYTRQPLGIIIDLRNSQTQNGIITVEYASLFTDGELVSRAENTIRRIFKKPIMILIGGKSSGDAEIFASIMQKSGAGIITGENSAGKPFATFPIKLKSGGTLLAPDIPTDLEWVDIGQLIPSIRLPAYPQISYEKLSGEIGSENSDEAVRRLCELLISIDAVQKDKDNKIK